MKDYEKYETFSWQLKNSFFPKNYKEYDFVDEEETKQCVKKFAFAFCVLFFVSYLFLLFKSSSAVNNGSIISEEDGYKYSIKGGYLKIDKDVFIDDLSKGIYVNITDKVEAFDAAEIYDYFVKGYKDVLLISRTNRIKMTADSQAYSCVVNYFDDMRSTSEAGRNNVASGVNATMLLVLAIAAFGLYCVYPFALRLSAFLLAVVAGVFCKLFRLDTEKEHLKVISVYAFFPAQIISVLGLLISVLFTKVSNANFIDVIKENSFYGITSIIATLLPFVLVMISAFSEKKERN